MVVTVIHHSDMISDTLPPGAHIGFLIIALALLILLGQLHLLNAGGEEDEMRIVVVLRGVVIPLFIAFMAVLFLEAMEVVV